MNIKPYNKLKVALVSDEITFSCLKLECKVKPITPLNYKILLRIWAPDLLFVESAWAGYMNSWKFKIASYSDYPNRHNNQLKNLVRYARDLGILTIFWNKEDGIHFERFIDSAGLFDFIFTVDENTIPLYKKALGEEVPINLLMFAVQPRIHFPTNQNFIYKNACFIGSYSNHIHPIRKQRQDMLFAGAANLGITIFDRNSERSSSNYRFPKLPGLQVLPKVPHAQTADIYRSYFISLNVNTVEGSGTMFSRRLIEILACGGLAVTTPALSIDKYFRQYCYVVSNETETRALFQELQEGPRPRDREMGQAGAEYVLANHTWCHRLEQILQISS